MATIKQENGPTLVRQPTRLPTSLFEDDDSNDSFDTQSTNTEASRRMTDSEALLKAKLTHHFDDDEEVEIVEREVDEDEFGDEDVIVEEVDESEKTDNFKKVSEIIKTVPHLQFQKDASDVKEWDGNEQMIVVPPSDNDKPLHERFSIVCNREMKYSLNHYWQTYNYLRRAGEGGLELIQHMKNSAGEIAQRAVKTGVRRLDNTLTSKIAKAQEDPAGESIDPEYFWRENLTFWMNQFEWKRRDGPQMSTEELDKEIEEYMAQRAASRASVCSDFDIDADLADFMEKKGIIREDKEDLDKEMDDYWANKKTRMDENGEKENEVEGVTDPVAKSKGWTTTTKAMTPQERLRHRHALNARTNGQTNGTTIESLDKSMDLYNAKRGFSKERDEKERKVADEKRMAAEAARQKEIAKQQEGDLFADEDFDVYQEAMEM